MTFTFSVHNPITADMTMPGAGWSPKLLFTKKRETKRGWFRKLTNNVRNTPTAWLLTEELPTKDEKQLWTRAADFASNAAAADREEQPHALVKKIHPNLTVIQCINHKAELEVHEGAKSVTGLSPFHTFIDSQTESLVLSSINKDSRLILSTSVGKRGATSCRWCKNALIEAECLFITDSILCCSAYFRLNSDVKCKWDLILLHCLYY